MTAPKFRYLVTYNGVGDVFEIEGLLLPKGQRVEVLSEVAHQLGERRDIDVEKVPIDDEEQVAPPAPSATPDPQANQPAGAADDGSGERDPAAPNPKEGEE